MHVFMDIKNCQTHEKNIIVFQNNVLLKNKYHKKITQCSELHTIPRTSTDRCISKHSVSPSEQPSGVVPEERLVVQYTGQFVVERLVKFPE